MLHKLLRPATETATSSHACIVCAREGCTWMHSVSPPRIDMRSLTREHDAIKDSGKHSHHECSAPALTRRQRGEQAGSAAAAHAHRQDDARSPSFGRDASHELPAANTVLGELTTDGRHAPMHPCTHAPMHPCTHAPMHPCTHAPMHPCTQGTDLRDEVAIVVAGQKL